MNILSIIAIIAFVGLLIIIISRIGRLNKSLDNYDPNLHPELDGGIYDIDLDDSYRLKNVLNLTWHYFDNHPMDDELTELHYATVKGEDLGCQICRQIGESGDEEIILLFELVEGITLPPYFDGQIGNPYEVVLKGDDAKERAAKIIKEVLGIKDTTKVPYQLAGDEGPVFYFSHINPHTNKPIFQVPNDNVDRRLSHIFELTWNFFREHPDTHHFTEVHTEKIDFQILSNGTKEAPHYCLLSHGDTEKEDDLTDNISPFEKHFCGADASNELEQYVYREYKLTPNYRCKYQLTSQNGPEVFFEFSPEDGTK